MATTEAPPKTLTRTQIIDEGKRLVISYGPALVLEFGSEYVADRGDVRGWTESDRAAVLAEAAVQAERVYSFLGYAR